MLIRVPMAWRSPAGDAGRLSILIFHRVMPEVDPLNPDEPDSAMFETWMRWVKGWFNVLPLSDAVQRLYQGALPARALAITFDDGYADNAEIAAPILHRLGLTATFFISTGYVDGGRACMWNDRLIESIRSTDRKELDLGRVGLGRLATETPSERRAAVSTLLRAVKHRAEAERMIAVQGIADAAGVSGQGPRLMMNVDQLRRLRKLGMELGAHTVTHPILSRIDAGQAWQEIEGGKKSLERLLGERVDLFAYPNGVPGDDYGPEHVRMVADCGFNAAATTAWGAASSKSQRFQLPRFSPWDRTRMRFAARMYANYSRVEAVAT